MDWFDPRLVPLVCQVDLSSGMGGGRRILFADDVCFIFFLLVAAASTRNEGNHSSISIAPSTVGSSFDGRMFPFHHPSSLSENPHARRGGIPSSRPALHTPASSPSVAPIQAPSATVGSGHSQTTASSPAIPPSKSRMGKKKRVSWPPLMLIFPPPPPNEGK